MFLNTEIISSDFRKELIFNSYVKGVNLAKGYGVLKKVNNEYNFFLNANTVGVFSVLANWKQEIQIIFESKSHMLYSKDYKSRDKRKKKEGHMHIIFSKSIPEIISAQPNPKDDKRRNDLTNKMLKDTKDPVTGILNIGFKNQCIEVSRIYDGKRRYNINTKKKELTIIRKNNFFEEDVELIKCSFDIEKIAGYTEKEKKNYPNNGIIWIKKYEDLDIYLPAKIKIETKWGSFVCLIKERELK